MSASAVAVPPGGGCRRHRRSCVCVLRAVAGGRRWGERPLLSAPTLSRGVGGVAAAAAAARPTVPAQWTPTARWNGSERVSPPGAVGSAVVMATPSRFC